MRLIYDNGGVAAVVTPTPEVIARLAVLDADGNDTVTLENKLIHIANKDLPTGTKYEIIADSVDLSDRTFRDAWTYTADASVEKTSADLTAEELVEYNMTENK